MLFRDMKPRTLLFGQRKCWYLLVEPLVGKRLRTEFRSCSSQAKTTTSRRNAESLSLCFERSRVTEERNNEEPRQYHKLHASNTIESMYWASVVPFLGFSNVFQYHVTSFYFHATHVLMGDMAKNHTQEPTNKLRSAKAEYFHPWTCCCKAAYVVPVQEIVASQDALATRLV